MSLNSSSSVVNETTGATSSANSFSDNVPKILVLSVIIILTLLGNGFVLVSIIYRSKVPRRGLNNMPIGSTGKMTRMYYFMLHLSLADVLTALLTLLSELIWTLTSPDFYGGNFVCKGVKVLQMVGPYLSSYILVMTAVDRFLAICHPLTNQVWTSKTSKQMVVSAWVISLILSVPQAIVFSSPETSSNRCSASFVEGWGVKAYVTWFSISNFFLPLLALIFCYARICMAIWSNLGAQKEVVVRLPRVEEANLVTPLNMSQTCNFNGHDLSEKTKTDSENAQEAASIQQTVVIILMYVACSTPFICVQLWTVWGNPSQGVVQSVAWLYWLLTLNSVVNPWVYLIFNRELRSPLIRLMRCGRGGFDEGIAEALDTDHSISNQERRRGKMVDL